MMRTIGITSINGFSHSMDERFRLIKNAGFDSILLWWGNDENETREERVLLAKKHGLIIENAHATTDNLNALWLDGGDGNKTMCELEKEILDCRQFNINNMVLHLTNGSTPPPISDIGIARIEKLIDCAESNGIYLAFENMRVPQHLQYVLDNYQSEYVGLCYDSGHEHIWMPNIDWLTLYSDRVFAIHLSDNFGNTDSHLIPFDGSINWNSIMLKLVKTSYKGTLTIEAEFHSSNKYTGISFESFLKNAFEGACSLEKINN